ncbi:hypothetical protein [Haloarcula pelagica]|uniref:hypothetical protein n=1 Tax=Halomicroarcula sp. GCM10025709 TaxID=3252669 RepID=UPI0036D2535E
MLVILLCGVFLVFEVENLCRYLSHSLLMIGRRPGIPCGVELAIDDSVLLGSPHFWLVRFDVLHPALDSLYAFLPVPLVLPVEVFTNV